MNTRSSTNAPAGATQAATAQAHAPAPATAPAPAPAWRTLVLPVAAMAIVIVLSNILVQFPINDWFTWGAVTYPLVFLVTDLTNRAVGPQAARRVAWTGFAVAVVVSLALAPWRIALASGAAFIVSQVLDILVFNRWRRATWWKAPLIGSGVASTVDTATFFSLAFAGTAVPWLTLAGGDLVAKLAMAVLLLAPYRAAMPYLRVWTPAPR